MAVDGTREVVVGRLPQPLSQRAPSTSSTRQSTR